MRPSMPAATSRCARRRRSRDPASRKSAVLWLAYADSGLVSDVKAGENRGVQLHHDHVVRSLHGPYAVDAGGTALPPR